MLKIHSVFKGLVIMLVIGGLVSCSPKMIKPKISLNHDIQTIREGDIIILSATGSPGAVYKWTGPNGQMSTDTINNSWTINLVGNPANYNGTYKVTEYLRKGGKLIGQATDTVAIKVNSIPLCLKESGTRFAFKKAGKYRLTILDVDIRTTTLTGYSLCLMGDKCISMDPNTNNTKCIDRPGSPNSYTINCSGDCPFAIVETQLHGPGGESMVVDNATDLENNILSFNDGKGFTIKMKVEPVY